MILLTDRIYIQAAFRELATRSTPQKCCSQESNALIIHASSNPILSAEANKQSCMNSSGVHYSCLHPVFLQIFSGNEGKTK